MNGANCIGAEPVRAGKPRTGPDSPTHWVFAALPQSQMEQTRSRIFLLLVSAPHHRNSAASKPRVFVLAEYASATVADSTTYPDV